MREVSLDLIKVVSQVGGMVARLKAGSEERQNRLQQALDVLHKQAGELESLTRKIASSKTTWLVAGLVDGLDRRFDEKTPGSVSTRIGRAVDPNVQLCRRYGSRSVSGNRDNIGRRGRMWAE